MKTFAWAVAVACPRRQEPFGTIIRAIVTSGSALQKCTSSLIHYGAADIFDVVYIDSGAMHIAPLTAEPEPAQDPKSAATGRYMQ